ncbi:MAG TPA: DUF748 domain-containing protein [Verrucomicrobiae bacterium]|nr:DUF748 domain-containing protein [Verrucomicrobiae bacterium]
MKLRHKTNYMPGRAEGRKPEEKDAAPKEDKKIRRHRRWRRFGIVLLVLAVLLGIFRAFLPLMVRDYVNRTLDQNPLYSGQIGTVGIHLWRGAYSIDDVRLNKTSGNVPVPLFAAKRVDFSVQWKALVHKKVVTQVVMDQPELNFVDSPSESESQSGGGGPWLQMIQQLSPFKVNSAQLHNGSVHFRTYKSQKPVDVYVSQVQATVDNLGNIRNDTTPLVATVQASGLVMDQAQLELKMTLDPFSYKPTFHLGLRLLGLDVTKINDLALTYGKFDFKRGWFDLVIETDCEEGQITGYVKPLFRNLKVFSLRQDIKEDNVLEFFWQALVGAATTLFKNQPHDQFGTLIPFTGDVTESTNTDLLATIGNILRNAFVRAYLPRLQNSEQAIDGMTFSPPDLSSPNSP